MSHYNTISNSSEDYELANDLRCPICLSYFSDINKPLMLECTHNICDKCVDLLVKNSKIKFYSCPICVFKNNRENMENLKVNYGLLNLTSKILENKLIYCKKCELIFYWKEHLSSCEQKNYIEPGIIYNDIKSTYENCSDIIKKMYYYSNIKYIGGEKIMRNLSKIFKKISIDFKDSLNKNFDYIYGDKNDNNNNFGNNNYDIIKKNLTEFLKIIVKIRDINEKSLIGLDSEKIKEIWEVINSPVESKFPLHQSQIIPQNKGIINLKFTNNSKEIKEKKTEENKNKIKSRRFSCEKPLKRVVDFEDEEEEYINNVNFDISNEKSGKKRKNNSCVNNCYLNKMNNTKNIVNNKDNNNTFYKFNNTNNISNILKSKIDNNLMCNKNYENIKTNKFNTSNNNLNKSLLNPPHITININNNISIDTISSNSSIIDNLDSNDDEGSPGKIISEKLMGNVLTPNKNIHNKNFTLKNRIKLDDLFESNKKEDKENINRDTNKGQFICSDINDISKRIKFNPITNKKSLLIETNITTNITNNNKGILNTNINNNITLNTTVNKQYNGVTSTKKKKSYYKKLFGHEFKDFISGSIYEENKNLNFSRGKKGLSNETIKALYMFNKIIDNITILKKGESLRKFQEYGAIEQVNNNINILYPIIMEDYSNIINNVIPSGDNNNETNNIYSQYIYMPIMNTYSILLGNINNNKFEYIDYKDNISKYMNPFNLSSSLILLYNYNLYNNNINIIPTKNLNSQIFFISGGVELTKYSFSQNYYFFSSNILLTGKLKKRRGFHCSIMFKGYIYIVGGFGEDRKCVGECEKGELCKVKLNKNNINISNIDNSINKIDCSMSSINVDDSIFETFPSLNVPRANTSLCINKDNILFAIRGKTNNNVYLNSIEYINLTDKNDNWHLFDIIDFGMCFLECENCGSFPSEDGKIIIFGGEKNGVSYKNSYILDTNSHYIYRTLDLPQSAAFKSLSSGKAYRTLALGGDNIFIFDWKYMRWEFRRVRKG